MPVSTQSHRSSPALSTVVGWGFWLQWVMVTLAGFLVSLLFLEVGVRPYVGTLQGAVGGAAIAIAQWLVLRQRLYRIWWWIVATAIAWAMVGGSGLGALGWIAPRTASILPIRPIYGFIDGAMVGAFLGLGQWFVLKRYFPKAGWWIFTSAASWAIALPFGWMVGGILRSFTRLFLAEVVGLAFAWLAIAAISGLALIRFLRRAAIE